MATITAAYQAYDKAKKALAVAAKFSKTIGKVKELWDKAEGGLKKIIIPLVLVIVFLIIVIQLTIMAAAVTVVSETAGKLVASVVQYVPGVSEEVKQGAAELSQLTDEEKGEIESANEETKKEAEENGERCSQCGWQAR